jgi:hypothetical protein
MVNNKDIIRAAHAYIALFKANFPNREFFGDDASCDHFNRWVRREGLIGWNDAIGDRIAKIVGG